MTTRNFADLQKQLDNQSGTSNLAKYKCSNLYLKSVHKSKLTIP